MSALPKFSGEAFVAAEERFQQDFVRLVGEISLQDVMMTNGVLEPGGLSPDQLELIPLTAINSNSISAPSRQPACHNVGIPEGIDVEYYEQVAASDIPRLMRTPFADAGGLIGLVGTFPKRQFGPLAFGRKRVLLAVSAGGIYPNLDLPDVDQGMDRPIWIVKQIQSMVRADRQPEYAAALQKSGMRWQGTLLAAQELVAGKLGLERVGVLCDHIWDSPREERVRQSYAQTVKNRGGYPRRSKRINTPLLRGLLWTKDLS